MVHPHHEILLGHKKGWSDAARSSVSRPRGCHTEPSQTQQDKYHIILLIHVALKKVNTNLFTKEEGSQIQKTNLRLPGDKGEKKLGGRD